MNIIETMIKRIVGVLGGLIAFLGVVAVYDQLTDGSVRRFFTGQGLSVFVVLLLYFAFPIGFYISITLVLKLYYTLRTLVNRLMKRKVTCLSCHSISPDEIMGFINKAEVRGVLEKDEARTFTRFVQDMEPIEFDILELCDNPNGWADNFGIDYPQWKIGKRIQVIDFALPPLPGKQDSYNSYIEKLHYKQLLSVSRETLHQVVSGRELLEPMTTPVGHRLAYIVRRVRVQQTS